MSHDPALSPPRGSSPTPPAVARRQFIGTGAAMIAGVTPLGAILRDPYSRLARGVGRRPRPVRIQGAVRVGGRGAPSVSVTDGLHVVQTERDGRFLLESTSDRPFVSVSVPRGSAIPTSKTGTASHFLRITPDRDGEMDAVFDLDRLPESDDEHAFLLLPDVQTEDALEMRWFHEQSVPDIQNLLRQRPARETFGLAAGDIMFDHLELYSDYERGVKRIGVPFFQIVGNHDLDQDNPTDIGSTKTFTRRFGPRYYSFDRGAVHYVVLDDVLWHGSGYIGYLDDDQLTWLRNDLAFVEPGRTVVVTLHIPSLGSGHIRRGQTRPGNSVSVTNREALYRLLEPYTAHLLCGHTHENDHVFEHGVHEHVSGTVCGAWWSGPICDDGTPSGYGVYDVRGDEVTWQYKSTGEPLDHQIRTYPAGSDPRAPDEFVANVWDWDPEWTVVWYEDGARRGEMARRIGLDPLSVELHTGPDLPERRTWVEPTPTRHLFYAPYSASAREIRVEATDRFGRTYDATVPTG